MQGHALIIGSQTHGLAGVLRDAARVADTLEGLGFDVVRCVGAEATREGILRNYRRLIETCAPGEPAFVYYSGHGAWSSEPGHGVQFIVPVDFECSTEGDFRGITTPELSGLLKELTSRTRNVSVVLDCCFAARMFRSAGLVSRSLPEVPLPIVRAHLTKLQAEGIFLGAPHVESNPHAVRLVASALDEPAYERPNGKGECAGVLTDVFLEVFEEARGLRVSWGQFGRRVRERVLARCPQQRPELEGPGRRLLFQLEEVERDDALAYYPRANRHWLRGGHLHGVYAGNEYAVMPLGSLGPDPERALATARVVQVQAGSSQVELKRGPGPAIPAGAPAFLLRAAQPRRAVVLEGSWAMRSSLYTQVVEAIEASSLLRLAPPEEGSPLARLQLGESGMDVFDRAGDRIVHTLPPLSGSVPAAMRALELLARAQALLELDSGSGARSLRDSLDIEWGRGSPEGIRKPGTVGLTVHVGERLYVRFRNIGFSRLYVSAFDIGVGGAISLLTASHPSGLMVAPGREETLGVDAHGRFVGMELEWPSAVPQEGTRLEYLVVIASETPEDLRLHETLSYRGMSAPPLALDRLLHGSRGREPGGKEPPGDVADPASYAVKRIWFWLDPLPLL